jgi:hypothetical protein
MNLASILRLVQALIWWVRVNNSVIIFHINQRSTKLSDIMHPYSNYQ